jgi:hypothetical protein
MKTVITSEVRTAACIVALSQLFYSCEDHNLLPVIEDNYFPLVENTTVVYQEEYLRTADATTTWWTDTTTLVVSGDTLIEGLLYKKIVNQNGLLKKVARQEGTKYYGRNHEFYGGFSREYLFLDSSIPVNGSWEHVKDEGHTKTEYIVKAVKAKEIIHGIEYADVIKLEVNYYNNYTDGVNWTLLCSASHVYANGVGEIYAYYPSPVSGVFGDLRVSALRE